MSEEPEESEEIESTEDKEVLSIGVHTNDTFFLSKEFFNITRQNLLEHTELESISFEIEFKHYIINDKVNKKEKFFSYNFSKTIDLRKIKKKCSNPDILASKILIDVYDSVKKYIVFH